MERGHEIRVLDHGYVRLVDFMGSDEEIVEAARVSTGRGFVSWKPYERCKTCGAAWLCHGERRQLAPGDTCGPCCDNVPMDTEKFPRGDIGILKYLYQMRHTTPFEMCELKLAVKVPMDTWRQWIRHRTASVNEYSTRYSVAIDEMQATPPDMWRTRGATNRQGSGAYLPEHEQGLPIGLSLSAAEEAFHRDARALYERRLEVGVAKEQARKDLPLSTYTKAYWKNDLHNTLGFLRLRLHEHAQWEIRQYANAVAEIVKGLWPRTYALFEEYDRYAVTFSATEMRLLRDIARFYDLEHGPATTALFKLAGLDDKARDTFLSKLRGA